MIPIRITTKVKSPNTVVSNATFKPPATIAGEISPITLITEEMIFLGH